MATPTYRDGIERAAKEVETVCGRLDKSDFGSILAGWLLRLPDDPDQPHPDLHERPKPALRLVHD